jgi:3-hydroxyisobutyrate dehydrogenase-like beta-hydroxyacid dehydrogenase
LVHHDFRITAPLSPSLILITLLLSWQCEELVTLGAAVRETPASVIAKCNYTILLLSDPAAAVSVKTRRI